MTRPRATPSHSARSTSSGGRPVAAASSVAKHAPRARRTSSTSAVAPSTGGAGSCAGARRGEQPAEVGPQHDRGRRGLRRRRRAWRGRVVARARREAQPGDLAGVAQRVEPGRLDSGGAGARTARAPRLPPRLRSPAAARGPRRSPASPTSWVPGATCCQRSRKRMKSWAVTGSKPCPPRSLRVAVHARQQAPGAPTRVPRAPAR